MNKEKNESHYETKITSWSQNFLFGNPISRLLNHFLSDRIHIYIYIYVCVYMNMKNIFQDLVTCLS